MNKIELLCLALLCIAANADAGEIFGCVTYNERPFKGLTVKIEPPTPPGKTDNEPSENEAIVKTDLHGDQGLSEHRDSDRETDLHGLFHIFCSKPGLHTLTVVDEGKVIKSMEVWSADKPQYYPVKVTTDELRKAKAQKQKEGDSDVSKQ
jgi:hypothetical protein